MLLKTPQHRRGSDRLPIMVPTINSYILQQHLPDARLILYPDSGHGSHFQFPEEFAEEAARFFAAA
jgi:pimeloyl-ACP methyl ester carboxylesterase